MGDVYMALCPCGYKAEDLLLGSGMAGPESDCELGRCEQCREIVSISSNDVRRRCPNCHQRVSLVDRRHLEEKTQVCPKCSAPSLHLQHVGLWD
jgi:hypothetical protein